MTPQEDIILKPAMVFALLKTLPLLLFAIAFLFLAWQLSAYFILFGIAFAGIGWYRLLYIRNSEYLVATEYIRISRGIFFKRTDQVEMYRIKDYIITQSPVLQLVKLMDVTLKTTDPENPVVWLRGIPLSELIETIRERVQEARRHNPIYEIN